MNIFNEETKILEANIFPQHSIADLNSGIKFVLLCQEKPKR